MNPTPLENYLKAHPETTTVMLGFDMDNAGRAATKRFQAMLKKRGIQAWDISEGAVQHGKDWNAELKWHRQQEQKIQAVRQSQAQQSQGQQLPPQQMQPLQAVAPRAQPGTFSVYRLNDQFDIPRVCRKGSAKPKQYHRIHMEPLKPGDTLQSVVARISSDHLPNNYKNLPLIQSDVLVMHQNGESHAYLFTPQGIQEHPELVKVEQHQSALDVPQPENMMEMEF